MVSTTTLTGQRVTIPFGVTPGTQLKYGVSLNCNEVFSCLSALDGQLTYSDGPIEDLARCTKMMQSKNLYHCIQREIGTQNPAQMQRYFEPKSVYYSKDEGLVLSKKYRNYSRGKYLPSRKTLKLMSKATGHDWLHHLYVLPWSVFDTSVAVLPSDRHLQYLETLQLGVLTSATGNCHTEKRPEDFEDDCMRLLNLPGMRALLGLVLVLRVAHESGNQRAATIAASVLSTKLIMMGVELQLRGIACLLFRLAVHHLFPLAEQHRFGFSPRDMVKNSMFLNFIPFFKNSVDPTSRIKQDARETVMCEWHRTTELLRRFAIEGPSEVFHCSTVIKPQLSFEERRSSLCRLAFEAGSYQGKSPL